MDLIYYASGIGQNIIFVYIDLEDEVGFDFRLTNPCQSETKDGSVFGVECNGGYELYFEGVQEAYEDLDSGAIYFDALGTWKAELYQQGATKNAANLLKTLNLQITTLS